MSALWNPLHAELEHWENSGTRIPFWWRDDDAIAPTPDLDHLLDLSERLGLPVHIAVIPAHVGPELATHLKGRNARVLTHGWAHDNHAPKGEKKAEFRNHRPIRDMETELTRGKARIDALFTDQACPIFVPPWNRISPEVSALLPKHGYRAVSTYLPRRSDFEINTHIDPIDWRNTRSCLPAETLIAQTVDLLAARRRGQGDASEPLGLLTHHLVHDPAIWDFTKNFITQMLQGPVDPVDLATYKRSTP